MSNNSGDLDARATAKLLQQYHKEQAEITKYVAAAIEKLHDVEKELISAKKEYEDSYRKILQKHLPSIAGIVCALLLFGAFIWVPCFTIDISKFKIIKPCAIEGNTSPLPRK